MPWGCCTYVADASTEQIVSVGMEEDQNKTDGSAEKKASKGVKLAFNDTDDVVKVAAAEAEEGGDGDKEYVEEFQSSRTQTKRPPKYVPPDEDEEEEEEEEGAAQDEEAKAEKADQKKRNNQSLQSKFNPNHGLRNGVSVVERDGTAESLYKIQDLLGAGGFGEVFKVQKKGASDKIYAMKNIPTGNVPDVSRFELELEISKKLNHPNIVKLHETIRDESTYYLIMDLLSGGDLFDLIVDNGGLKDADAGKLLWQMLSASIYLHHYKFVHRDIKPENYMLESKTAIGARTIKLIDFGLARHFEVGSADTMTSKVGTRNYMGPEVWQQQSKGYNESCDVWSIGVTLFVMLVANFPWNAKNDATFLRQVQLKDPNYDTKNWKTHCKEMMELCKKMLQKDPKKRPKCQELIPEVEAKWPNA